MAGKNNKLSLLSLITDISFTSVLTSSPFKFLVGPEKKPFIIHATLVAQHSKPLGNLINGRMSEATDGCALLDDVDEDTFACFGQFAYTGDYKLMVRPELLSKATMTQPDQPFSKQLDLLPEEPILEALAGSDHWNQWGTSKNSKKDFKLGRFDEPENLRKPDLWDEFCNLSFSSALTHNEPANNSKWYGESPENIEACFLHAKIYVFAEQRLIEPLKELSFQKIQRQLTGLHLTEEKVSDLVQLLEWIYSNTLDGGPGKRRDNLRLLLAYYVAYNIELLSRNEGFETVLEENGALGRYLVNLLKKGL